MRTTFPEQYPITESSLESLWSHGLIVFDTNTLLRLYRYKKDTSDEILELWKNLGQRLWIPHQVGWEYNKNRLVKIKEAVKSYTDIVTDLKNVSKKVSERMRGLEDFGVHPQAGLEDDIKQIVQDIDFKTEAVVEKYNSVPTDEYYASIHNRIGDIFEDKVGAEPTTDIMNKILKDGNDRYKQLIPPGLKDVPEKRKRGRPDREVFGDFLIWSQILDFATSSKKGVIFVTEDLKDDWWLKDGGDTIGVLPELRAEFLKKVGCEVQFYRIASFLKEAKKRDLLIVSQDIVTELTNVQNIDDERTNAQISHDFAVESEYTMYTLPNYSVDQAEELATIIKTIPMVLDTRVDMISARDSAIIVGVVKRHFETVKKSIDDLVLAMLPWLYRR